MQHKLWQKDQNIASDLSQQVEKFTVGKDRELDIFLAPYDVLGSLAHIQMLSECGLLDHAEWLQLQAALRTILYR